MALEMARETHIMDLFSIFVAAYDIFALTNILEYKLSHSKVFH